MQTEATKGASRQKASSPLDQFDPLSTGQLAMDAPASGSSGTGSSQGDSHDDNLLKEWNLDFKRLGMGTAQRGPIVPPKPPPPVFSASGYRPVSFNPVMGPQQQRPSVAPIQQNSTTPHVGFWTAPRGYTPSKGPHTLGPHVSSIMSRLTPQTQTQSNVVALQKQPIASSATALQTSQDPFSDLLDMTTQSTAGADIASSANRPAVPYPSAPAPMPSACVPRLGAAVPQPDAAISSSVPNTRSKWERFD